MLAVLFLPSQLVFAAQSEWAHIGADGRLNYRPLPAGDRILDFSHAGYLGGGQRIPDVPVQKTITPSGSDDSMAIQTAINDISRRALRDGFRGAAKPADIWAGGTQTLVDRCAATGDNLFYFSTGARMQGPVVVLNCVFHGDGHVSPHMRWATGLLIDCCQVPEGGIDLMNRGEMGTGHGWTIGWSVAWNCRAKTFLIQQPPGSANWAIGCTGKQETAPMPFRKEPKLPQGYIESEGQAVVPASLFLAQLRERLGAPALANIGY